MTTPTSIRNQASRISAKQGTLRSKNSAAANDSTKTCMSWKGETSEAYKDSYKKAQTKINRLVDNLGSLAKMLSALANAVNKAASEEMKE